MNRDVQAMLGGAAAGALATIPMSAVMVAAEKAGLMGTHPPELVAEKGLAAAGAQPSEAVKKSAALIAHFGFGTAVGALFGLVANRAGSAGAPIARGIGYGLLVYAASYAGWIPATGIMPPPPEDRPGRQPSLVLAHVVFGAALGALTDSLAPLSSRG